jgi:hypothetical protein
LRRSYLEMAKLLWNRKVFAIAQTKLPGTACRQSGIRMVNLYCMHA